MPRRLAAEVLERVERTGCLLAEADEQLSRRARLGGDDLRLYWEITHGVVRHRDTLDHLLTSFATVKLRKSHPYVIAALRLGVYQMVYLDRVPPAAAAYESVEVVKRRFPPPIVGFANAVLRAVSGAVEIKVGGTLLPEDRRRAVPIAGGRHCLLAKPVFPDPDEDETRFLALTHSHPTWLVDRWLARFGRETTESLLLAGNDPPDIWLRPAPGRIEDLDRELRRRGLAFETVDSPCSSIRFHGPAGPVRDLPGYRAGWFTVQDRTAMRAAVLLDPGPGDAILDLCAAPGGKTTHLAELGGPDATVIAVDRNPRRLRKLEQSRSRLGLSNIAIVVADAADPDLDLGRKFDRVLADVPCSNTGVLSRRVEARHRVTPETVESLTLAQRGILETAVRHLEPGGTLVYSTCSLLGEENGAMVKRLVEDHPLLELEQEIETLPQAGYADGGYLARLRLAR